MDLLGYPNKKIELESATIGFVIKNQARGLVFCMVSYIRSISKGFEGELPGMPTKK